ncbi:hypothetical protein DFP73DRAFT_598291 [Morchella snyderi]|nr:hypothetical protein DFP73DRAFT_598291 [Morchella snyderi]
MDSRREREAKREATTGGETEQAKTGRGGTRWFLGFTPHVVEDRSRSRDKTRELDEMVPEVHSPGGQESLTRTGTYGKIGSDGQTEVEHGKDRGRDRERDRRVLGFNHQVVEEQDRGEGQIRARGEGVAMATHNETRRAEIGQGEREPGKQSTKEGRNEVYEGNAFGSDKDLIKAYKKYKKKSLRKNDNVTGNRRSRTRTRTRNRDEEITGEGQRQECTAKQELRPEAKSQKDEARKDKDGGAYFDKKQDEGRLN